MSVTYPKLLVENLVLVQRYVYSSQESLYRKRRHIEKIIILPFVSE